MLNELKIKQYCDKKGFSYRYFHNTAVITTGLDIWSVELIDVYDKKAQGYRKIIKVKHQNTLGNKKKKAHFHTQRIAYDLDFVFNNIIIPHKMVYQSVCSAKDLLLDNMQ